MNERVYTSTQQKGFPPLQVKSKINKKRKTIKEKSLDITSE
jgi:hypothetical protein